MQTLRTNYIQKRKKKSNHLCNKLNQIKIDPDDNFQQIYQISLHKE
jgi:hypothetical protein